MPSISESPWHPRGTAPCTVVSSQMISDPAHTSHPEPRLALPPTRSASQHKGRMGQSKDRVFPLIPGRECLDLARSTHTCQGAPTPHREHPYLPRSTHTWQRVPTPGREHPHLAGSTHTRQGAPTPVREHPHLTESTHTSQRAPIPARDHPHLVRSTHN